MTISKVGGVVWYTAAEGAAQVGLPAGGGGCPMETADAPYFSRDSYAGFWLRLLVDCIDILVVTVVWLAVLFVLLQAFPSAETALNATLAAYAIIAFSYFVVLKRSRIGTVCYRLGGVRLVGIHGGLPSL